MRSLKPAILGGMVCVTVLFASFRASEQNNPHPEHEVEQFRLLQDSLPDFFNGLFSTSGTCKNCHGHDPEGIASVTPMGDDVNVVDAWRSSMMANSAKDPYWRAKINQEMLTNPEHAEAIGNFCTKCHAPLGRHAMEYTGVESYTFEHMLTDTAGLDGVSCVACHQQSEENLGNENSGNLHFEQEQIAYGPYESPLVSPMALESGYEPVESAHIQDAGICAGCHTLITNTVDLDGEFTGTTFIEQATYLEWQNSSYDEDELNVTCQSCHMPSLGSKVPIHLAAGYDTPGRAPFSKHTFAGANRLMLSIMQDNLDTLGIAATSEDYDATLSATLDMLQIHSLDMELFELERTPDTLRAVVALENLAGHKFPSGYPARRLFISCTVREVATNDILWQSGEWDSDFYLVDEDEGFEPHYNVIRDEAEVQIYEMVMADVNGDPTTVLERADTHLKDNRLVPLGFNSESLQYDSTALVGAVLTDPNFNLDELGFEGSAIDSLYFHIPMFGFEDQVEVTLQAWYQSVPPKWTEELFAWDDPFINHFETMYNEADRTPTLIAEDSFTNTYVGVEETLHADPQVYMSSGGLVCASPNGGTLSLYSLNGQLISTQQLNLGNNHLEIQLSTGVYVAIIETPHGQFIEKLYFP